MSENLAPPLPSGNTGAVAENYTSTRINEVVVYFVLAYAFSTLIWLPVLLGKNRSFAFTAAGTFGPTVAALVTSRLTSGRWHSVRWWSTLPKFTLGLLAGGSLYFFADFLIAVIVTKSGFDRWHWAALWEIATLFPMNLLGGPLGEEAGWRGFALSRIQQRMSPTLAAVVVGTFWAGWHYPLILVHIYSVSWWQFLLLTVSSSIIISFCFNIGGGSTACAIVLHGIYNLALGVIGNDVIGKAQLRSQSFQMQALWVCYVVVALTLCIATKGQLANPQTASSNLELAG